ncbi:ATP synthase F1 subunit delta [Ferruginibacter yonginensis]|uniref:ATP synthase subunit delta n=1 Tax=Ferruginibacter yonginensis TaxID=1310416 RepID=A0ABV8QSK3_9BACT
MNNPRLAARYAKSLLDLSVEQHQLDTVYADMKYLHRICLSNPDFVTLLRSPIITSDKKNSIINAVAGANVSQITNLFITLLTSKHRESNLPEITTAFIEQYNKLNNIQTVKLTTAVPVSDDIKQNIVQKVKGNSNYSIELQTAVKEELIGGFKLEVGGTLVDATILHDLNEIKKQFLNNEYIYNIR